MKDKDLRSLMEAYEEVTIYKEFAPEDYLEMGDGDTVSLGDTAELPEGDLGGDEHFDHEVSEDDMVENEESKQRMVEAHLHTIRSHAHEIHSCVENGANIEQWMAEKIAIANDYIVHVANAIMYRK